MEILNDLNTSRELTYILIRAFLLYLMAVFLIRTNRRLHIETSFDFVFIIMIGAMMERGIFVDSTTFLNTIATSILFIAIQKLLAYVTFFSKSAGHQLKGKPILLYQNGRFHRKEMESEQVTEEDIMAACRKEIQCNTLKNIDEIFLERTGKISFIKINK